jgi:large subunit ribosomal protein L29
MKVKEELKDLREKDAEELLKERASVEKELLNLRFRKSVNQIPDTSLIQKLKRKIARIETVIAEKQVTEAISG